MGNLSNKHFYMTTLLTRDEVSHLQQDKFVLTGYRPPSQGWIQSLMSAFKLHNETFNFWSHALALAYFIFATHITFKDWEHEVTQLYPLIGFVAGICALFGVSSFAHLCSCVSETWRDVCFMMDYAAICLYGVGAAVAYYAYCRPVHVFAIASNPAIFLVTCVVLGLGANLACCLTRLHHTKYCIVIRTFAFALPFLYGSIPGFSRFLHDTELDLPESQPGDTLTSSPANQPIANVTGLQHSLNPGFADAYLRHFLYMAMAALVNVTHFPECIVPGAFDIVGHSHQLFHVFIFMAVREQFSFVLDDIKHSNSTLGVCDGIHPTHIVIAFSVLVFTQTLFTIFFSKKIIQQSQNGSVDSHEKLKAH